MPALTTHSRARSARRPAVARDASITPPPRARALAAAISHELNNALLAASFLVDAAPHPRLASLLHQSQSLSALLLQLNADPAASRTHPIDPGTWTKSLIAALRPTLPTAIQIKARIAANLPPLQVDPIRLEHILRILIGNAAEALGNEGTIEFSVTRRPGRHPAHDAIEFRVSDNGPGVPTSIRPHLFRSGTSTRRHQRPLAGLGLSLARQLADDLQGSISFRPLEPHGSCFVLRLPSSSTEP